MKIILKNSAFILSAFLLLSCFCVLRSSQKTMGSEMPFLTKLQPLKMEYFLARDLQTTEAIPIISIDNQGEMQAAMKEICEAKNPSPMKGVSWDRLVITCEDTVVSLNTNSKNLGFSTSGTFYSLKSNNFITKRLKKTR